MNVKDMNNFKVNCISEWHLVRKFIRKCLQNVLRKEGPSNPAYDV